MEYTVAEGVTVQDAFQAQNVLRKRKTFHITELKEEVDAFLTAVETAGAHPSGPLVYSLNNVPEDGNMDIEFFLSVEEDYIEIEGMRFSSYFEIDNIILTAIDRDYEELTKEAYARLLWTLEQNDRELNTPFYHVLPDDGAEKVIILVGYAY